VPSGTQFTCFTSSEQRAEGRHHLPSGTLSWLQHLCQNSIRTTACEATACEAKACFGTHALVPSGTLFTCFTSSNESAVCVRVLCVRVFTCFTRTCTTSWPHAVMAHLDHLITLSLRPLRPPVARVPPPSTFFEPSPPKRNASLTPRERTSCGHDTARPLTPGGRLSAGMLAHDDVS
jgi:uncharacterized protein YggT (Ycf19 family)